MRSYKIMVMGSSGVGKSALTVRYVQGTFLDKYDPTIEDTYKTWSQVDGRQCLLEIVDTAGTQQFDAMRDLYIKDGDGFVLVFSVTLKESLRDVLGIRQEILRVKKCEDVPIVMVGNKTDLSRERVVSRHEAVLTALDCNHTTYVDCSAKSGHNVDEVFDEIVRQIRRKRTDVDRRRPRCRGLMCDVV